MIKAYVTSQANGGVGQMLTSINVIYVDTSTNTVISSNSPVMFFGTDITLYTLSELIASAQTQILAESVAQGYGMTAADIIWNIPTSKTFNNAPGATIQTSTGAVGTLISSSRDAHVSYSPTMQTTASISGNASDVIVLEICPTNSGTAGNWIEIARITNAQALSLAITLQSVQTTSGVLSGIVPAGYYRKIRAITSGTVSNSMSSGQEVLL